MKYRMTPKNFVVILMLMVVLIGCTPPKPEPTKVPETSTPSPTATMALATRLPTFTPRPTHTPDMAATKRVDDFSGLIQNYYENGYISTATGDTVDLDSFRESWAQLGWYRWWPYDTAVEDFVLSGHFKWSVASSTPEVSGCGVVFGLQENDDHYAVFLDANRILFLMARGSHIYNVGKTKGSGRTNFGNPAEADFVVAVKGQSAFVSVDGEVTEYTLSADQTSKGNFGFTLLSGTNKDYGTKCEVTNVLMWVPK